MRGYVRQNRTTMMSSFVVVVAAMALIAAALNGEAFRTPELKLHDAGVWIANGKELSVGRVNTQIAEVDVRLKIQASSGLELLQADEQVLVQTAGEGGSLVAIDGRTAAASEKGIQLPSGSKVGMAGPEGGDPTLAVLAEGGDVWVASASLLLGRKLVGESEDDHDPPAANIAGATALAVGADGVARVYSAKSGEIVGLRADGSQAGSSSVLARPEESDLALSSVGSTPVVLDVTGQELLVPGRDPIDLQSFGTNPRLQQPGGDNSVVLVGTDTSLLAVPLGGGAVEVLTDGGTGGAAAPVFVRGCAWAAWSGAPTAASSCRGSADARLLPLDGIPSGKPLRFRTNRGKVVINESESGEAYVLSDGDPQKVDWSKAKTKKDQNESAEQQETTLQNRDPEQKPPTAKDDVGDDAFATRPNRAVVVNPLRNDTDPNNDVLVIERIFDVSAPDGTRVDIIDGGLKVQVTPVNGRNDTITFRYSINDGTASSEPATVAVAVRDFSVTNAPRCFWVSPQKTVVTAGASVVHNVLVEAEDPDGDALSINPRIELPADFPGTLTADSNGVITYRPPGIGFSGPVDIDYQLVDETGQTTECTLAVTVRDPDEGNDLPTARGDHATAIVGQEAVVDVTANDSDPDGDALRVVGLVPGTIPGGELHVDAQQRVHLRASQAQVYVIEYTITDGQHTASGLLRVDVTDRLEQRPPVAVRDDVVLLPTVPAIVNALANDIDPNGDVLVLRTIDVPVSTNLAVEIVDRQFLRISTADGSILRQAMQFTYTVTDGQATSVGTVVVRPGPTTSVDQPPDAVDDDVSVRAGTIAAVAVLANDSDPEGGRLAVGMAKDDEQEPDVRGRAFVQGDVLRFVTSSEPGTFRVAYQAVDPGGYSDTAFVVVHVLPADTANKAPRPTDLTARGIAGEPIVIPVATATMDPDGDTVTLLGVGDTAPAHGSVTAVDSDRLTYVPDAIDTNGDGVLDGFFGTDSFSYRVRDSAGAEAIATIRVGVAAPALRNTRPVAIDDSRSVPEDGSVRVDVVRNDSDPDGDDLRLDEEAGLRLPSDASFSASIEGGRVVVDAGGLAPGTASSLTYTVTDGVLTDTGLLTVTVVDGSNQSPLAVDDAWGATSVGETVTVPVLDNDIDPDGERDDLRVIAVDAPGGPSADGRGVTVTMPETSVKVVYTVEDANGARSKAVLVISVADAVRRRPLAVYDSATISAGETASVAVLDNDTVSSGTKKVLFEARDGRGGTCGVEGDKVRFTPAPEFVGLGGCTYLMGDGAGDDPLTLRAVGQLGATVKRSGNTPPTFRTQPLSVQADSEITVDLRPGAIDADEGDVDRLGFGGVTGATDGVTGSFQGSELTVRAASNVLDGTQVVLSFDVTDPSGGSAKGSVEVTVAKFRGSLAVAVPDTAETFQDVVKTIPILANDQPGASGDALSVVSVTQPTGATVAEAGGVVTFTPASGFFGETSFSYTVNDGTDQVERQVTGTVTVNVIGRPGRPPAPSVVRESKAITLSWGVPSPNGSPITRYLIRANGPGGGVRESTANSFRFDGLTNGAEYTFEIAAVNSAVEEALKTGALSEAEYSAPSPVIVPNQKPNTPAAPAAKYDPTGGSIDVTWSDPGGDGTAIESYTLEISPPPSSGGQQKITATGNTMTTRVTGLTNGVPYTFRVKAFNTIQGDVKGESEWSATSAPETPAKPPDAPLQPQPNPPGDGYIEVTWQPPANNGDAVSAYVVEYYRDGALAGATGELPASQRLVRVDTTNGSQYTFRVRAKNKAGFGEFSPMSPDVVSYGLPGPVSGVTIAETPVDGELLVTVSGSPNSNGSPVTGWQYRAGIDSPPSDNYQWQPFGGPGSNVQVPLGHSIGVQVRACNGRGCASDAGPASNTLFPQGVPGAPMVNVTVAGRTIAWSWQGPYNTRAVPIDYHEYSLDGGPWNRVTGPLSWEFGYAETHTLRARAVNRRGTGPFGEASARTVDPPVTTKALTADGSHWGCPGTYCGPNVSRLPIRDWTTDRVVVARGTVVQASCQTTGGMITDPVTGIETNLWVRTTYGDAYVWMSAHYFGTTNFGAVVSGLPACP